MLTGVELTKSQIDDATISTLVSLRPDFVTVRNPAMVSRLLDLKPSARILARSMGEGDQPSDAISSYEQWLPTLDRYRTSIVAYSPANEPNMAQYGVDPVWWVETLKYEFTTSPVPIMTPGLQPYVSSEAWRVALDGLGATFRGAHLYWQNQGPVAALSDALAQVGDTPRNRVIVSEFNSAAASPDYQPTIEQRADECRQAVAAMASAGIYGASLFALDPWYGEGDWTYAFDLDTTRTILAAGQTAPKPARTPRKPKEIIMPAPEFRFGFKDFAQAHPEVGEPSEDEQTVGNYAFQMTSAGVLVFSQAAANAGNEPIRFLPAAAVR